MTEHFCKYETQIQQLNKIVIVGNGKEGLLTTVTKLSDQIDFIIESMEKLSNSVEHLIQLELKTMGEKEQIEKADRKKLSNTQVFFLWIVTIVSSAATIIAALIEK